MESTSSNSKNYESVSSSECYSTNEETSRGGKSLESSKREECVLIQSEEKVENQIVRCTEITCMYSSCDDVCKTSKPQEDHCPQPQQRVEPVQETEPTCKWKRVINTSVDCERDILLEIDAGDSECCGLKDVQAVELVIAVQSAIKQRQELIEEWKTKTMSLTEQIEKLQQDKFSLEKSNLCKDSELELLARKLHDLHKQYKNLLHDSSQLKRELELLKIEYKKLTEAYNTTVAELKETKKRLSDAIETEKELESRLRQQMNKADFVDQNSQKIETELEDSRTRIKKLTCSLDETTHELMRIKQHMDDNKSVECELERIRSKYKQLRAKYDKVNKCLRQSHEENGSLKQAVTNLNITIENLTRDKEELVVTIESLTNEKNCLLEHNSSLSRDLKSFKHNFSKVQIEMKSLQSEVDSLKAKIEDLESCNVNLYKELNSARHENKKINDHLHRTVGECTTLSRALSEAQSQLEIQQKSLLKVETKVRILMQEKQVLESALKSLKDEQKNGVNEVTSLTHENNYVKGQNNELICKLNKVTVDLNESLEEVKNLENEISYLRQALESEKTKHENHIIRLQEKIRNKSREWKEYVTKEVQRLRNKRRNDIKKYLDLNKDLECRLQMSQEDAKMMEMELNQGIMELTKQLEISRTRLEEAICQARSSKAELMEHSNLEINKLKEIISRQKIESQWMVTELESKIQQLVEKNLDDEAVVHTLTRENQQLREKIAKVTEECQKLAISHTDLLNYQKIKSQLECELANCKGLLRLAEETQDGLRAENTELLQRLKSEEEHAKSIHVKLCKLKKIIGKKDAHIEMLDNTICQLKESINQTTEENATLKATLFDLDSQHQEMTDKIKCLNQELIDAKRALIRAGDDQVDLIKSVREIEKNIKKLECDNSCLKEELLSAKENERFAERNLENSQQIQAELREKLSKAECMTSRSSNEAKQLECKLQKMQETVRKLESEISTLTEAYQYNDSQHKKKIENLEQQLSCANQEICALRHNLEKSEHKITKLKERLRESKKAFCSLIAVFDHLRETLCQILCIDCVQITSPINPESHVNYSDIVEAYKSEVDKYSCCLVNLKKSESELECKLTNTKKDFEKLSRIMKELQSEYMLKVEKLYQSLKQKDEVIRTQEKQLISIQLEAAEADDVLAQGLKGKIEDQQNYVRKLQDEKSVLQSEILCLAKKVNHLESQIFELVEKLKCIENRNSKLQIKNVSLEGELEKLTLLLKDARDVEQDQICQYKQMMLANRELMDKIRNLKSEIEKGHRELDDLKAKKSHQEQACCMPTKSNNIDHEMELETEIRLLTEKLSHSQKAEIEAKNAMADLDRNLSVIKKDLAESQSEKASLEGWVTHLQQMISGGYVADSNLPNQLCKVEGEKKNLQKTVESLKTSISTLIEEKTSFKTTIDKLSNCNSNLKESIDNMSKNKDLLEKELLSIQKKVDYLYQANKNSDTDLSNCTKDISDMIENACNLTKILRCSDVQVELGTHTTCKKNQKDEYPFKLAAQESTDSISVELGCQSTAESGSGCFIKKYESAGKNSRKHDLKIPESRQKEHNKSSTTFSEIHLKHTISKKSSRESLVSDKSSKTFV